MQAAAEWLVRLLTGYAAGRALRDRGEKGELFALAVVVFVCSAPRLVLHRGDLAMLRAHII